MDPEQTPLSAGQLLLTTDGTHDQVDQDVLHALVAAHAGTPQALAGALAGAAAAEDTGYATTRPSSCSR